MTYEIDEKRRDDQSPAHMPGVCVTRRSLMNKLIALSITTAIPIAAEAATDPAFALIAEKRAADVAHCDAIDALIKAQAGKAVLT